MPEFVLERLASTRAADVTHAVPLRGGVAFSVGRRLSELGDEEAKAYGELDDKRVSRKQLSIQLPASADGELLVTRLGAKPSFVQRGVGSATELPLRTACTFALGDIIYLECAALPNLYHARARTPPPAPPPGLRSPTRSGSC